MRDVIEQYSQGNMDLMIRLKELQRRMDQTIGPPSRSNDRERIRNTISARLTRVEDQLHQINVKIEDCLILIKAISVANNNKNSQNEVKRIFE